MTNFALQKQLYSLSREGASQLWKSWEKITILNYFPNKLWKSETESDQGCKYVKTIGFLGLTADQNPKFSFVGEVFSINIGVLSSRYFKHEIDIHINAIPTPNENILSL